MEQLLQAGLNVTAIGMGVVFVLLTLLVGIIRGMSALSHRLEAAFPAATVATRPATPTANQNEIVGVISAAIAAHRKEHHQETSKNG